MPFLSLGTVNFRNLKNAAIDLSAQEIFLIGENGQGKTNLLEALYFLAYGSSFRTKNDAEIAAHGADSFSLKARYKDADGGLQDIAAYFEGGKKRIEKNGKRLLDRKELVSTIPCVLYSHDDLAFVDGQPERRRFFLDQTLSMHDVVYIDTARQYRKALKSKNLCLKNRSCELLPVYDEQLSKTGSEIQRKRRAAVAGFNALFSGLYTQVTGIEDVSLAYRPSWPAETEDDPQAAVRFLESKRDIDVQFGASCYGPHRDKIVIAREGRNFVPEASTGQRMTAAILLRSAKALFYEKVCGKKPVLLLDDVLLELDPEKRRRVTALLPEYEQLFYTFLPEEPCERYRKADTKEYTIRDGVCYG
jgi:DNA replication and repair protein RecF